MVILYQAKGDSEKLDLAIRYVETAIRDTPQDHGDLVEYLSNLAVALIRRFNTLHDPADLDYAIQTQQQVVNLISKEDARRATCLRNLGISLFARTRISPEAEDLKKSTSVFTETMLCSNSLPSDRIQGAWSAAHILIGDGQWEEATQALELLLDLIPRTNSRDDMQNTIRNLSGFASFSASVFFKAGREPAQALQALNKGRGIVASFMIDAKSDSLALKTTHPKLCAHYVRIREQINECNTVVGSGFRLNANESYAATSERLRRLYVDLDDARANARSCVGFERFLLEPTDLELRGLAREGPLVSFSVSRVSRVAFLLLPQA